MKRFLKIIILVVCLITPFFSISVSGEDTVTDSVRFSPDFVKVSVVVAAPGDTLYSTFGHTAIRMQCPSLKMDYCFSYNMESNTLAYLQFLAGQANSFWEAVPTSVYIQQFKKEGRGITQYNLNLTPQEKSELWRRLDIGIQDGTGHKFNLLKNNCTTVCMQEIEACLIDEYIETPTYPAELLWKNGVILQYASRYSPWYQFLYQTVSGTEADITWPLVYRIIPEVVGKYLAASVIKSVDGKSVRPLLKDPPQILQKNTRKEWQCPVTPDIFFSCLLILVILVTVLEWKPGWKLPAHWTDYVLFTLQSVIGIFLLYITLMGSILGRHWNWVLIPLNPLPLFLWLLYRRRSNFERIYLVYTVILVVFIVVAPFVANQIQPGHQLIAASLAVRCLSRYLQFRGIKKNNNCTNK